MIIPCYICGSLDIGLKKRKLTLFVKGKKVEIDTDILYCKKCNSDLMLELFNEKLIKEAIKQYKQNNNLLTSLEIKEIRKQLNLSTAEFSKKLGFTQDHIKELENGIIQSGDEDLAIREYQN